MGKSVKIKESCGSCKFWKTNQNPSHPIGTCRANPPTNKGRPTVHEDEWCGMYRRK